VPPVRHARQFPSPVHGNGTFYHSEQPSNLQRVPFSHSTNPQVSSVQPLPSGYPGISSGTPQHAASLPTEQIYSPRAVQPAQYYIPRMQAQLNVTNGSRLQTQPVRVSSQESSPSQPVPASRQIQPGTYIPPSAQITANGTPPALTGGQPSQPAPMSSLQMTHRIRQEMREGQALQKLLVEKKASLRKCEEVRDHVAQQSPNHPKCAQLNDVVRTLKTQIAQYEAAISAKGRSLLAVFIRREELLISSDRRTVNGPESPKPSTISRSDAHPRAPLSQPSGMENPRKRKSPGVEADTKDSVSNKRLRQDDAV